MEVTNRSLLLLMLMLLLSFVHVVSLYIYFSVGRRQVKWTVTDTNLGTLVRNAEGAGREKNLCVHWKDADLNLRHLMLSFADGE